MYKAKGEIFERYCTSIFNLPGLRASYFCSILDVAYSVETSQII